MRHQLIQLYSYEVSYSQKGFGSMAGDTAVVGEGSGEAQPPLHRGLQLQQQPPRGQHADLRAD